MTASPLTETPWAALIPETEWALYKSVLERVETSGFPFAIGGGFAFSHYAGRWRDTKDIDLYILPRDRASVIAILTDLGFTDFYDRLPYDRGWIYRGFRDGVLVDLIWASANAHHRVTDEQWFARADWVSIRGVPVRMVPVEELVFTKLYVVQRDRCDWPDLLNVLHSQAHVIDWEHLLFRVGEDARLLGGLLSVFGWVCAPQAHHLPEWVWPRVGLLPPNGGPPCANQQARIRLLDSRDWFGPSRPHGPS